ncbi:MAG: signal peptidase I [Clostridiales bacterium]|nr:signal peptidase I [Clostridiales bacterium]
MESADQPANARHGDSTSQSATALEKELHRITYKKNFHRTLRSTISTLITVAAISVLVATLFLPVLQIYGSSMTPTLTDGNIVISLKVSDFEQGDILAFYYNNKVLVKRVIATGGQWVSVDEDGNVYVDGKQLDEPYVSELAYGECDIEFPYQVPEGKLFVMGDHRSVSVDSRSSTVGCVASEQIVGKLVFRIWPLGSFGKIE